MPALDVFGIWTTLAESAFLASTTGAEALDDLRGSAAFFAGTLLGLTATLDAGLATGFTIALTIFLATLLGVGLARVFAETFEADLDFVATGFAIFTDPLTGLTEPLAGGLTAILISFGAFVAAGDLETVLEAGLTTFFGATLAGFAFAASRDFGAGEALVATTLAFAKWAGAFEAFPDLEADLTRAEAARRDFGRGVGFFDLAGIKSKCNASKDFHTPASSVSFANRSAHSGSQSR